MQRVLLIIVQLSILVTLKAQNYSIYGTVKDKNTGEFLIGATIYIKDKNIGTVTNNYGFYSITLQKGEYAIIFSYLGYESTRKDILLNNNSLINVELQIGTRAIEEVVVTPYTKDKNITEIEMSSNKLNIELIKFIPASFGEVDVIKSIQLLPGVQTSNEGTTNLSIRGGSFDQNLIILDEAPVYNPSHALGFFSTFNNKNEISFYDLNAKFNLILNYKNRLYFSTYTGQDHFYYYAIDDNSSMNWGNITSTLRWNHIFNSKIFSNTSLIYSNYDYAYILKDDTRHFRWSSRLNEIDLKTDFDYYINPKNQLRFGISTEFHHYYPGKIEPRDSTSITKAFSLNDKKALISSMYIHNTQKITNKISFSYGLRYSAFLMLGDGIMYNYSPNMERIIDSLYYKNGELIQFYHDLEPRISIRLLKEPYW